MAINNGFLNVEKLLVNSASIIEIGVDAFQMLNGLVNPLAKIDDGVEHAVEQDARSHDPDEHQH